MVFNAASTEFVPVAGGAEPLVVSAKAAVEPPVEVPTLIIGTSMPDRVPLNETINGPPLLPLTCALPVAGVSPAIVCSVFCTAVAVNPPDASSAALAPGVTTLIE